MTPVTPNHALIPPGAPPAVEPPERKAQPTPKGPAFADVLRRQAQGVQFSGHASQRVQRRGIDVGEATRERLQAGVDRAAGKGSRNAVVFVDQTAFVVSVSNRTVITAVDREHMKDQIFTNIDSAVVA